MQTADTSRIQQALILKHNFKPFLPEILRESGIEISFTVNGRPDIGKTVNGIAVNGKANANKYYLSNYERIKYYPDKISIYQSEGERFAALSSESEWIDRMDLCAFQCRKYRIFSHINSVK